jgi:hypothetical protein
LPYPTRLYAWRWALGLISLISAINRGLILTVRKSDNLLKGDRTPAYVDRVTGAAEVRISPETWDTWVDEGRIPPAAPGFPDSCPRWRWDDVDAKFSGKNLENTDPFMAGVAKLRHGPNSDARR